MNKININEHVSVTALGFKKNMVAYPRRMEFRGVTYNFIDAGLRCLLHCGGHIAEFFTLTDGKSDFHLRIDNQENIWMLLSIVSAK